MTNAVSRAEILQVGLVVPTDTRLEGQVDVWLPGEVRPEPQETITLWHLDCLMSVPLVEVKSDGTVLWAGYTVDELREISKKHYGGIKGMG